MWEFYLASSEMAFREQAMMVFQLQLTKRQGVVPITRDYITHELRDCAYLKVDRVLRCDLPVNRLIGSRNHTERRALAS